MASEKDICNLALRRLGQSIGLIDTAETSAYAEVARDCYPIVRDALLERHAWNFATKRVYPAKLADTPVGKGVMYQVPSDCLRVLSVESEEPIVTWRNLPWTVENWGDHLVVQTEIRSPILKYICRVRSPGLFSAGFTDVLSWHLAATLAGPIVKGEQGQIIGVKLLQQAQYFEQQAIAADVNQRRTVNEYADPPTFYAQEA